jgi:hypothetical protein
MLQDSKNEVQAVLLMKRAGTEKFTKKTRLAACEVIGGLLPAGKVILRGVLQLRTHRNFTEQNLLAITTNVPSCQEESG